MGTEQNHTYSYVVRMDCSSHDSRPTMSPALILEDRHVISIRLLEC